MADVRQVHALSEGRRRHDAGQLARPERRLDGGAVGAGEAGVVERDARAQLGHAAAQGAAQRDGLIAGVDVHDALLPVRHDRHQAVFAVGEVALVIKPKVVAHGGVHHDLVDARQAANLIRDVRRRRGGGRQHARRAQEVEDRGHLEIRGPVPALGARHMVCLVHHNEPDAPGRGEALAVDGEELGSGEHDIELAGGELGK